MSAAADQTGQGAQTPITLDDRARIAAGRRRSRQSERRRGLVRWVRSLLVPGAVRAPGVRFRPRSGTPLPKALSGRGPGVLVYDARFESGETMAVRATRQRIYDDLSPDPRKALYALSPPAPGKRVIELGGGTGAGAALLADAVGPTGSVVSLDRDAESVRFGAMRYPRQWLSFGVGGLGDLGDELDSSYDLVIAEADELGEDPGASLEELCRVTRVGGEVRVHAASRMSAFHAPGERARGIAVLRTIQGAVRATPTDLSGEGKDGPPAMLVFHIA